MSQRKTLKWEETKSGEFGDSLEKIQAEFQSFGLTSKGSNLIVQNGIKIGKKLKYLCNKPACDYAARILVKSAPGSTPEVETSGKRD